MLSGHGSRLNHSAHGADSELGDMHTAQPDRKYVACFMDSSREASSQQPGQGQQQDAAGKEKICLSGCGDLRLRHRFVR